MKLLMFVVSCRSSSLRLTGFLTVSVICTDFSTSSLPPDEYNHDVGSVFSTSSLPFITVNFDDIAEFGDGRAHLVGEL
jgi:hypothetical protein